MRRTRRDFLRESSLAAGFGPLAASDLPAAPARGRPNPLRIDPAPLFPISPYLYMQFMEPLGVTDGSVEAAWD